MAPASEITRVLRNAFISVALGLFGQQAQAAALSDVPETANACHPLVQTATPPVSEKDVRASLEKISKALSRLSLNDLIYIEDILHELPEDDADATRALQMVDSYFEMMPQYMPNGRLMGSFYPEDTLKMLSRLVTGYTDFIDDLFGIDQTVSREFAAIEKDREALRDYSAERLVAQTPDCQQNNAGDQNNTADKAHTESYEPVLAF